MSYWMIQNIFGMAGYESQEVKELDNDFHEVVGENLAKHSFIFGQSDQ